MMTIHKFSTRAIVTTLQLPANAKPLSWQLQDGNKMLWVELDTDEPNINRVFEIFGTGNELGEANKVFIGTVQQNSFVWHLYEIVNELAGK